MSSFGPDHSGQLVDPSLGFEFDELFSAATQPTFQHPSPNEPGPSNAPTTQPGRPPSTQGSSAASSPLSGTTSNTSRKRVRPKIALAPGQPPTARGNDRIRVYVACHECRSRKIRCDGAKPICVQCQKRPPTSGTCSYDAAPNRKGHDRRSRGVSRGAATTTKATKRRRTAVEVAAPTPSEDADRSSSSSDTEQHDANLPGDLDSSREHAETEVPDTSTPEDLFDAQVDDTWEYDPFAFDPDNPELFQFPQFPALSPPHSNTSQQDERERDESIPSRPSIQFARDTWWDALLAFYALERDITPDMDMHAVALTSDQRNRAMRFIVSDLRAAFQSAASWMSHIHLPRFFASVLDPSRRAEMQPSLLLSALAIGVLTQSSEVERGSRGRSRALKLLEMAHSALQSSLATGWVDVGLAQAGWMIMYFELNTHPQQTWERSQSAMLLLDSLVRLFSLTSLDASQHRIGNAGSVALESIRNGFAGRPEILLHPPASSVGGFAPNPSLHPLPLQPQSGFSSQLYGIQEQFTPQPNAHAFEQPIPNLFYSNPIQQDHPIFQNAVAGSSHAAHGAGPSGASRTTPPHSHAGQERRGCDCVRLSLKRNWPSVMEFAPSWQTTIMWPVGLSEAEFRKEECRRLVWSSVAMIANLNAYASITPQGIIETGRLFVREFEDFALQTPSETLARAGAQIATDDIWSLSLRSMLLLHACLRVRASPTLSGAQRAEFATRAWLEIDDIERRMERHTCGLASNYGFQSMEMLFSLRLCVSYEFQRFIPQVTTTGSALFYRDKAEAWLRHLAQAVDEVWAAMRASVAGDDELNHRKSLFIFWFMSGIKKCLMLWEADPTLSLALTTACQAATHLENFLLFWPATRVRNIWQNIRYQLVGACMKAGLPPPSVAIPRPIPRNEAAVAAAVAGTGTGSRP